MKSISIILLLFVALVMVGCNDQHNISSDGSDGFSFGEEKEQKMRAEWEYNKLKDPATGKIPENIREKELAFAASLPKNYSRTVNWVQRGPYNVGGRTRAVAIDVTNENIIFAGAASGGLWKSIDAGQTWKKVSGTENNPAVTCIVQDKRPGKTNIWYIGTGEAYGASSSADGAYFLGGGIFKSTDNGETWTKLSSTGANTPQTFDNAMDLVWNIKTDNSIDSLDIVYAATYGAIWQSKDGGTTWKVMKGASGGFTQAYCTDVEVTANGIVYGIISTDGGTQKGIWRSADRGATWVKIQPTNFPTSFGRLVLTTNPLNENEVYFLGNTNGKGQVTYSFEGDPEYNSLWKYTYVSGTGAGADGLWEDRSPNLPKDTTTQFDSFYSQGGYDLLIKVKPDDPNTIFIGGTNLYRSTDGFKTKTNTKQIGGYGIGSSIPYYTVYPNHHPDQHNIIFLPSNPNIAISASDGGVNKTMDVMAPSVTWNSLNNGYYSTQLYTISIDHSTAWSGTIAAGAQDNGTQFTRSFDTKANWTMPSSGDGSYVQIADKENFIYFSRQQGKMLKAKVNPDGTLGQYTRIDPAKVKKADYDFINPFILDPNDNNIMYLSTKRQIWRCTNLSQFALDNQWNSQSIGWDSIPGTLISSPSITCLAMSKVPANRLYYGTTSKKVFKVDNANSSNPIKTEITSTLFPAGNVNCIAVDPRDADKIIVVFSNYNVYSLFYSADAGTSWEKIGGNLEPGAVAAGLPNGPSIRWASIIPTQNRTAYLVGTSIGLFAADTLMQDSTLWVQQSPDVIGNAIISMMDNRTIDGMVAIATHSNGVYSGIVGSPEELTGIHSRIKKDNLIGIYPNPAVNYFTLSGIDPKETFDLDIYDINGRKVKTMARNTTTTISTAELNSGIYIYKVKQQQRTHTGKFVVRK